MSGWITNSTGSWRRAPGWPRVHAMSCPPPSSAIPAAFRLIFRSLLRCALGRGAVADVSLRALGDGYVFTVSGPVEYR